MSNEANTCRKYVEPKLEDAGWETQPLRDDNVDTYRYFGNPLYTYAVFFEG
ncbi:MULTISPECIES: hypothetical protein [Brasilonema]|uniref:hypothetical protein n=1 Tax=Brasilonema TaxID=383614 RepID=UPI00145D8C93|nr:MULTISPECIES: hypothetical protein [Brasilonema]